MPRITVNNNAQPEVVLPVVETPQQPVLGRSPGDLSTDEELKKVSNPSKLSTFCVYPQNIHFAGQMDNEQIVILLRAHIATNIPWILGVILGIFLPPVVIFFLNVVGFLGSISGGIETMLTLYWYMGLFAFSFLRVLFWYFNVGVVTNERVVDVDWNSLTNHDVAAAQITQLQDVRALITGVLAGIFDYGSVYAQTAGTDANIEFINVPHAQLVVRKIEELMQVEEIERGA